MVIYGSDEKISEEPSPKVIHTKEIIKEVEKPKEEKFDFWRFMNGFFPTSGKSTGKLLHIIIVISIGLFIYNKFFVTPMLSSSYNSHLQNAENVTYNQQTIIEDDRALFFGLQIARVKFGFTYEKPKVHLLGETKK